MIGLPTVFRREGDQGFSLIEVIITILVIAIIGAAVLVPFVNSLSGSPNPVVIQQATDLVQGELDQVIATKRANGFAGVGSGCSGFPMTAGFGCTRTVCYVPAANLNDTSACATVTAYKRITVTVNHALVGDTSAVLLVTNY